MTTQSDGKLVRHTDENTDVWQKITDVKDPDSRQIYRFQLEVHKTLSIGNTYASQLQSLKEMARVRHWPAWAQEKLAAW
jgi:hypothetical protein